jgi:hypothetical protein
MVLKKKKQNLKNKKQNPKNSWALVAHTCNPSYLEAGIRTGLGSRPVGANSL